MLWHVGSASVDSVGREAAMLVSGGVPPLETITPAPPFTGRDSCTLTKLVVAIHKRPLKRLELRTKLSEFLREMILSF